MCMGEGGRQSHHQAKTSSAHKGGASEAQAVELWIFPFVTCSFCIQHELTFTLPPPPLTGRLRGAKQRQVRALQ